MDKVDQYDDNKLASDENIALINKEYEHLKKVPSKLSPKDILSLVKRHKYHICMPNYGIIRDIFLLEKDSVSLLYYLANKARLDSTKAIIRDIIAIKERNISHLAFIYIRGTSKAISYTPNIKDKPSYNALFEEIELLECRIIAMLDGEVGLMRTLIGEHSASILLAGIKP